MTADILSEARQHLLTLPPHVKNRRTAQLLTQVCDELEEVRKHGYPSPHCDADGDFKPASNKKDAS